VNRGLLVLVLALTLGPRPGLALERAAGWVSEDGSVGRFCALGDVDGDGFPELAVLDGNLFPFDQQVTLKLYDNRGGQLEQWPSWTAGSWGEETFNALAFGDADGDGLPELAVDLGQKGLVVFANRGGRLEAVPSWRAKDASSHFNYGYGRRVVRWADLDGSGSDELLAAWFRFLRIYYPVNGVLPATADLQINWSPAPWSNYTHLFSFAVGDIDGDGRPDLALGYQPSPLFGGSAGVGIFLNRNGTFEHTPDQVIRAAGEVSLADADGDGDLDLLVGMDTFLNEGGRFQDRPVRTAAEREGYWYDLDGDGRADVILADQERDEIFLGRFTPYARFPQWRSAEVQPTGCLVAGDVNGDGWPDLVAVHYEQRPFFKGKLPSTVHFGSGSFRSGGPPRVLLAGYADSALNAATGGVLQVLAAVSDPLGADDITAVELLEPVSGATLSLPRQSAVGDTAVHALSLPLLPGAARGSWPLVLRVSDDEGYTLADWPFLRVY
jgi:hypothetical protein